MRPASPRGTGLADDAEQDMLRAAARANVMRLQDSAMTHAVMLLAEQINEDQLQTVLANFVHRETRLGEADLGERLTVHFRDGLGLGDADHAGGMIRKAIASIDDEALIATATALQASGVANHQKRAAKMHDWLANDGAGRCEKIDLLVEALFTKGKPQSRLANKNIRDAFPRCEEVQREIQEILLPCMVSRAAQRCRELTMALYQFGMAFQREYAALKRARGLLDYDDLINITNNLMDHSSAAQWVAWKLDNGIRHLLIDEAQDTSPSQWKLLRQLSLEFFDDQPDAVSGELDRTLFAVGDFKQSIFSFQGADPRVMQVRAVPSLQGGPGSGERTFRRCHCPFPSVQVCRFYSWSMPQSMDLRALRILRRMRSLTAAGAGLLNCFPMSRQMTPHRHQAPLFHLKLLRRLVPVPNLQTRSPL